MKIKLFLQKRTGLLYAIVFLLFMLSCDTSKDKSAETALTTETVVEIEKSDWISLFNGTTTKGWRGFNQETLPESWVIEDGLLKSLGAGGDIGGDIVYGAMEFENFELYLEWKISKGGNSGIFYHVVEGEQYNAPYENAPEYQVLDDPHYAAQVDENQLTASDYSMYTASLEKKKLKPVGEWNTSRIVFTKSKVEHWLNGDKLLEFVPWSKEWNERRNSEKWKDYPDYGKAKKGHIGLQDHGSLVWFRNIRIRKLQ